MKRGIRGNEQDHNARWHSTIAKAAQSVKNARSRIYDDKSLLDLPDVGPTVLKVRCDLLLEIDFDVRTGCHVVIF